MKRNLIFLFVIVILIPAGFWGLETDISTHGSIENYHQAPSSKQYDLSSFDNVFNQLATISPSTGYSLEIVPIRNDTIELYGLIELSLQTNLSSANPYDPNQINLRVVFFGPSGKEVDVGAFWYQDFDPKSRAPRRAPGWKVRFTPDEVGDWIATAYAPAQGLRSSSIGFMVEPSNNPGFIRRNPKNPRYLAFENGDFFFPIGLNMAWWSGCCDPIDEYRMWLDQFTANGGNTIRVWMADWSFGIEWKDTGLGNYDERQYVTWLLDRLFELAAEHGVKIILVLINHGAFSLDTNSEWKDNPFNSALGGPLSTPDQFVEDPVAREFFKQKLNYIINRWGYSPDLLAWEWFNEVNLTPITDNALLPWLVEMTVFLHNRDVNRHLTTLSFALRPQSLLWMLPGLDIIQAHEYSSQINVNDHDLAGRVGEDFQELSDSAPAKPILLGEFGYSADNYGDDVEITGIHLHNGIWSTTFSGYAGSGMYWWWDIYIAAHNLWQNFKGLATYLHGIDLAEYRPLPKLQVSGPDGSKVQVEGLGLKGPNTLVWLRSNMYTTQASAAALGGMPGAVVYTPPLVEGFSIQLQDMDDGHYTVSWFDPQAAVWLNQQTISANNQTLVIPIPAFRADLAAEIVPLPREDR